MTITNRADGANGFDPDFAGPAQWAAMYRAARFQPVPAWSPAEHKQWKRPKLPEWRKIQNEILPQSEFDRLYGPGGQYVTRKNMGVVTGECSDNLLVVDLDTQKTAAAADWWNGLLAVHNSNLPIETVEQRTGGGGRQLLFRAPAGRVVPTCKTPIGVDIRGHGGFAMLPPSMHESGHEYVWLPGQEPWEMDVATAPDWLLDAIDALVKQHGGTSQRPHADRADNPEAQYDGFGHRDDGRESYMRDLVWAAMVGLWIENPIGPPSPSAMEVVWQDYARNTIAKEPVAGETNEQGLEREGRGRSLFEQKWAYAAAQWDVEVAAAAAERRAREPGRASEPPNRTNREGKDGSNCTISPIPLVSAFPIDKRKLPVRDWITPGLLLRRHLTVLVAPPSAGKSLLTLQWSITLGAGISWGGWSPRKPEKVLVINAEDDADEMRRRLVAAAEDMGVSQEQLVDRVLLAETPESIVIARMDARTKAVIRMPLIEVLVETIKSNGIGVVVVDPFAETFEGDENSNSELKWAAVLWREVARRTGTAVLVVHHTRKYAGDMAGVADASRGGGALIGTARILVTLFGMTEDEAAAVNIPVEDRSEYVRFDDAKTNYAKIERARWFRKKSVSLDNGNGFVPADEVGVFEPWSPPGALDGVSMHDLGRVLDTIDRGIMNENGPTGQFYSASGTADEKSRWAGRVMMDLLGCSSVVARSLIKDWLKNEVLETFDYLDPAQRRSRKGVKSVPKNRPDAAPQYERM